MPNSYRISIPMIVIIINSIIDLRRHFNWKNEECSHRNIPKVLSKAKVRATRLDTFNACLSCTRCSRCLFDWHATLAISSKLFTTAGTGFPRLSNARRSACPGSAALNSPNELVISQPELSSTREPGIRDPVILAWTGRWQETRVIVKKSKNLYLLVPFIDMLVSAE